MEEIKRYLNQINKMRERDIARIEMSKERAIRDYKYYKEENRKLKEYIRELEAEIKALNIKLDIKTDIKTTEERKTTKKKKQNKLKNITSSKEYKLFRESILQRDNYKCTMCGSDFRLQVHHIKPKSKYPELIMDKDNCITLCILCHSKTESFFN